MSVPKGKAGVDASTVKTKDKSDKATGQFPKLLLKRQISPREPHPYSLKAELEEAEQEEALAAKQAKEDHRQTKRAAYFAAAEDDEIDGEEDDADDAYAEEIRLLHEEDDPESDSHQAAAERPPTSDGGVWASGTDEQKARVREFAHHFDRDKVEEYSSHDLLLLVVLWSTWIKKTKEAIDKNDPDATRAGLKKLKGEKKWLAAWLEKHRPLAVEKAMRQPPCEDPLNAKARLLGMDKNCVKKHGNNHGSVDEEQHASPKGPATATKGHAGSHGKVDVPAKFYSREYKGRVVVIFEWTRELVKKRLRERHLPQQAHKGVSNLHVVLSQLLYWLTPKQGGKPLAGGKNVICNDGVWWVWLKPSRFKKGTGVTQQSVRSAVQRLEALGLVEGFEDKESGRTYVRPRAESFATEVDVIVAAPAYGMK